MNIDYDPKLQDLFARAEQKFDPESFTHDVMRQIDRERRRMVVIWSVIGIAVAIVLALLATPVFTALSMATQLLPASIVDIETGWLQQLVSPVNSVAAAVALGILGVRKFFRSLFN